jgi:hypothetical protein
MAESLAFEIWKIELRDDCETAGKLSAFNAFDDSALELLFQKGLAPTHEAIANDGGNTERRVFRL